jgi:RecA/RadA recombinase
VNRKWTLAHQINVVMELAVHQARTIKISIVHVPSVMQEDCVMKTSTNVNFHLRRAEMEQHVKTLTDLTNASVLKDMKDETAQ